MRGESECNSNRRLVSITLHSKLTLQMKLKHSTTVKQSSSWSQTWSFKTFTMYCRTQIWLKRYYRCHSRNYLTAKRQRLKSKCLTSLRMFSPARLGLQGLQHNFGPNSSSTGSFGRDMEVRTMPMISIFVRDEKSNSTSWQGWNPTGVKLLPSHVRRATIHSNWTNSKLKLLKMRWDLSRASRESVNKLSTRGTTSSRSIHRSIYTVRRSSLLLKSLVRGLSWLKTTLDLGVLNQMLVMAGITYSKSLLEQASTQQVRQCWSLLLPAG